MKRVSALPELIRQVIEEREAQNEVTVYKITTEGDQTKGGILTLQVRELFKSRQDPFPSKIHVREE